MEQFLTPTGVVWCDQYRCLPSELQLRAVKRWGEQDGPPTVPFSCIFLLSVKAVEARIHTFCRWPGALFRAPIGSHFCYTMAMSMHIGLHWAGSSLFGLCVGSRGGTCLWGCRGLGTKIISCLPGCVGWLAKRLWDVVGMHKRLHCSETIACRCGLSRGPSWAKPLPAANGSLTESGRICRICDTVTILRRICGRLVDVAWRWLM